MKKIDLYISSTTPAVHNSAAWLKPTNGGFTLYILDGTWKPLVLEGNTNSEESIVAQDLIGTTKDGKNANTINGAKAYADNAVSKIIGNAKNPSTELTLNGLKAYINEQIAGLE